MSDQKRAGYVESRGTKIYYRRIGKGTPLIMLHGNGERHQIFKKQVEYLSKRYQVILVDSRGHGRSHVGNLEYTIELLAEDVHHVTEALDLERVILFGFSDGANAALQMAACYPDEVLAVVAVSGNIQPKGLAPWFLFMVRMMYLGYWFLEKLYPPSWKQRQLFGRMAWYPQMTKTDLAKIQAPVLILTGSRDIVRPKHSIQMGDMIPHAQVRIFKDSNHFSMFQRTEAYMKLTLRYLQSIGLSGESEKETEMKGITDYNQTSALH